MKIGEIRLSVFPFTWTPHQRDLRTMEQLISSVVLCTMVVCVWGQQPGVPAHQQQGGQIHQPGHGDPNSMHMSQEQLNNPLRGHPDADHIMEHLSGVMNKRKEDMTEEELQFYYFKLHDYDNNNKLDGVELIKAITHFHKESQEGDHAATAHAIKPFSDDEISNIVDVILEQDDLNGDGYIEYLEFATAHKRAEENENSSQE